MDPNPNNTNNAWGHPAYAQNHNLTPQDAVTGVSTPWQYQQQVQHPRYVGRPPGSLQEALRLEQEATSNSYNAPSDGFGFVNAHPAAYGGSGLQYTSPPGGQPSAFPWHASAVDPQLAPNGYGSHQPLNGQTARQNHLYGQPTQIGQQYSPQGFAPATFSNAPSPAFGSQSEVAPPTLAPVTQKPQKKSRAASNRLVDSDANSDAVRRDLAPINPAAAATVPLSTGRGAPKDGSNLPSSASLQQPTTEVDQVRSPQTDIKSVGNGFRMLNLVGSARGQSWTGVPYVRIGDPVEVPDTATVQRLKRQDIEFPATGTLLFPGRNQPIPAEIRGILTAKEKTTPILLKGDRAFLRLKAQVAYESMDKELDPKLFEDGDPKARPERDAKDAAGLTAAGLTAAQARIKACEYVECESWLPEDRTLAARCARQFTGFFVALRAGVKSTRAELDRAIANKSDDVPMLMRALESQRAVMNEVIDAVLDRGSAFILDAFSGSAQDRKFSVIGQLLYLLVNDLLKTSDALPMDINGAYAKKILSLLARLRPTGKDLGELKFPKLVVAKYKAHGDQESLGLIDQILQSAGPIESTESADKPAEPPVKKVEAKKGAASTGRVVSNPSPAKRRLEDNTDARVTKKLATSTSATLSAKLNNSTPSSTGSSSASTPAAAKSTVPTLPAAKTSILLAGKSRVASTSSASKSATSKISTPPSIEMAKTPPAKPQQEVGTSAASSALPSSSSDAKVKKPEPTKVTPKSVPAAPGPSKLAALMAEINEPKKITQPAAVPEPEIVIDETPEEKAKRLRKLERRKLRVSWKGGDELTQVRVFEKTAAEEEDTGGNMTLDARDDRSEGQVLKESKLKEKEKEKNKQGGAQSDEDDEDDIPDRPWVAPTPFDFSGIPEEQRKKNWVTRGGYRTFHTEEQKKMEEREKREIMVVYTSVEDIPPTPKSPPPEPPGTVVPPPPADIYLPTDKPEFREIHQRWADAHQFGPERASQLAQQRLQERKAGVSGTGIGDQSSATLVSQPGATTTPQRAGASSYDPAAVARRDAEVLQLLNSPQARNFKDPNPNAPAPTQATPKYLHPDVQKAADYVEGAASPLRGKPVPPVEPPAWLGNDPVRVKEWWDYYHFDQLRNAAMIQTYHQAVGQGLDPQTATAIATLAMSKITPESVQGQIPPLPQVYAQAYTTPYQQQPPSPQLDPQVQRMLAEMQSNPQQPANMNSDAQLQATLAALAGTNQPGGQPYQSGGQAMGVAGNQAATQYGNQSPDPFTAIAQYSYPPPPEDPVEHLRNSSSYGGYSQGTGRDHRAYDGGSSRSGSYSHHSRGGGGGSRGDRSDRDRGDRGYGRGHQGSSSSSSDNVPPHLRNINRSLIGTKPCMYYRQGKCTKGDLCTFRHD